MRRLFRLYGAPLQKTLIGWRRLGRLSCGGVMIEVVRPRGHPLKGQSNQGSRASCGWALSIHAREEHRRR